jgi:hypothetical protein
MAAASSSCEQADATKKKTNPSTANRIDFRRQVNPIMV